MTRIHVTHGGTTVVAELKRVAYGFELQTVVTTDGPAPDIGHLSGATFPDQQAVHLALVAAIKGRVGDTLDNVLLSPRAYRQWQETAAEAVRVAASMGLRVDPDTIPDEMAKSLPDGRLLIWVDVPGFRRIQLVVPNGQWTWRNRPN